MKTIGAVLFVSCGALFIAYAWAWTWWTFMNYSGIVHWLAAGQLLSLAVMAGGVVFGAVTLVVEKEKR
jgi:hypothetical protein